MPWNLLTPTKSVAIFLLASRVRILALGVFATKTDLHKGTTDTKIKFKALKNGKGHFSGTKKRLDLSLLCFVTNNSSTIN